MIKHLTILTIAWGLSISLPAQDRTLLSEDFHSIESLSEWRLVDSLSDASTVRNHWRSNAIHFTGLRLESPSFAVSPLQYHQLDVKLHSPGKLLWGVVFYDSSGNQLLADHYSSIDTSDTLRSKTFYFQSKANTRRAQLWIIAEPNQKVILDKMTITTATTGAVAAWIDSVYASIPPLSLSLRPDRFDLLPNTLRALKEGRKLRAVMLGNSIINDTGNSAWDVLVEKQYPGSDVEVITSVRSGTGCQYYQLNNRVDTFVVQYQPDLLMIGGISHGNDTAAIHQVIRQVRQRMPSPPEIMVMSGPVGREGDPRRNPDFKIPPSADDFRIQLQEMATNAQVTYFDIKSVWGNYILGTEKPYKYFLRDPIHANARGRQILARTLEAFFQPTKPK